MRVAPLGSDLDWPDEVRTVMVRERSGAQRERAVTGARAAHDALLLRCEGVESREAAAALRGAIVHLPMSVVEPAGEGEAYVYELVGAQVIDVEGRALGTLRQVVDNPGHDLMLIETPEGERLLPMVPEVVRGFDRERHVVTVALIEGLWE